jgi:hypothetical protein
MPIQAILTLSTETAEALALHQGSLVLSGLVTLEPAAARALSGHGGDIDLFKLTQTPRLDSADVAGLLADKTPLLSLPNVNRMDGQESIAVARALAGGGGSVSIAGCCVAEEPRRRPAACGVGDAGDAAPAGEPEPTRSGAFCPPINLSWKLS